MCCRLCTEVLSYNMSHYIYRVHDLTRIGVFAQAKILCTSPNGLQAGHCDAPGIMSAIS